MGTDASLFFSPVVIQQAGAEKPLQMRAALVLLSLSSVAAFGGGKVIAGCLDPTASNYNTPGPVTLEVPDMCIFYPAPPAPPMTPGRYGRGKGECCTNDYKRYRWIS